MLLIQTILVFEASENLPSGLKALLVMSGVLGVSALIFAVRGPRETEDQPWWRTRHER
ncbi:hypothetical protein [Sphingobium olei]|uniref:Uncharacterized protein n=1 Tax=Sphingobium olei TaxID=420955 RepID=A0ABW3NXT9_9SPHN